ncbi:MAG: tRNA 2-thiouridine(34) synthase MnmA [Chloroflexi bacterium]|nr:tRNA 2-thiouridine(34) synthase MnmA [Chloroflexota bacterium]
MTATTAVLNGLPDGWREAPEPSVPERVLVALSGGVDSSVAAALLVEAGHEVVGVWMRLHSAADQRDGHRKSCCTLDAADDARRVADHLGIPFHIQNLEEEFANSVLDPFVAAYESGETPSPCVGCNTAVKFGALVGKGSALFGCTAVATGHYARRAVTVDGGSWRLRSAIDSDKDQTYFLHGLDSAAIARARFPLGGMTKPEVREAARQRGLVTAEKPESQEICFVPDGDYRSLLRERGVGRGAGEIIDESGAHVGTHAGTEGFTVGQRKGLPGSGVAARYVSSVDPVTNRITIAPRAALDVRNIALVGVSTPDGPVALGQTLEGHARIRHRGTLVRGTITGCGGGEASLALSDPLWAPSPGQTVVMYDGETLVAGARIARPRPA